MLTYNMFGNIQIKYPVNECEVQLNTFEEGINCLCKGMNQDLEKTHSMAEKGTLQSVHYDVFIIFIELVIHTLMHRNVFPQVKLAKMCQKLCNIPVLVKMLEILQKL